MPHPRLLVLIGLSLLCSPASVPAAGDPAAEELLKRKGLRKVGTSYVLPADAEVGKRLDAARATLRAMTMAGARQKAFERDTRDSKALIQGLTQQRIALNQQLARAATVEENNRIVAMINEVTDRLNLLANGAADPAAAQEVRDQVARRREEYLQALLDLRNLVDETSKSYADLADDAEVQGALEGVNRGGKIKWTLGPSRAFLANVKLLEKAEETIQTETISLRRDEGVLWVDVTLNNKTTVPMIFDTGASIVSLGANLAARAGLRPGPDDRTIKLQTADGSVTEAKLMTLPSMRVGKFTVEGVPCAVLPAELDDAPPLLGGSYLRNFTYRITPETGKLVLSKVEASPAARPSPGRGATKGARSAASPAAPAKAGKTRSVEGSP